MKRRGLVIWAALAWVLLACMAPGLVAQEGFPNRPVVFVVPWGAGGGSDQTARQLSRLLEADLKASFPIVNVPGATGTVGLQKLLSSPADGHSIAILAWDTFALLAGKPQRWSISDLTTLGIVIQLPSGLYVSENGKFKTWKEVEAYARENPNALKLAVSGFGSPDDVTAAYFASKGIRFNVVPYANPGERYAALVGGHADVLYSPVGNVTSFVQGKQMRPILVLNGERLPAFPDVPTSVEAGYEITLPQRRAVVVRAGTPPDRTKILGDALARAVQSPEYKDWLAREMAQPESWVDGHESLRVMERDLEAMKEIVQRTR